MIEYWQGLVLILTGIAAGFLNVMAGGGSLLTVPVMVFMDVPGPVANGTNRIAILAQNVTAVTTFFKRGFSDFRLSLSLALCALPGALAGAFIGTKLEGAWFNDILALIMFSVMILMGFKRPLQDHKPPADGRPRNLVTGHLLMVLVGAYGGFIQLGVGFLIMPVLHRVLGLDLVRVNMHKVFIIAFYSIAALLVFASQLQLLWSMGLILAVGNSIGGWLGAHLTIGKGERFVKLVLNIVLAAFIIKLVFFS